MTVRIIEGDSLEALRSLPAASVDAVVTDPPYPEISRSYGRWTEAEWWELMRGVVAETQRILKPSGSALFVLQPNYEKVGRSRAWPWEFMAWIARDWNLIEEAFWWNFTPMPCSGSEERHGLMRRSIKPLVWAGAPDCYRNQTAVLMDASPALIGYRTAERIRHQHPSGHGRNKATMFDSYERRGGVSPMNVLPLANNDGKTGAGSFGHGAGTPLLLCEWWTRYLTPPGGTILDPFAGSGTTGVAAVKGGFSFIGIEREPAYVEIAQNRLAEAERAGRQLALARP